MGKGRRARYKLTTYGVERKHIQDVVPVLTLLYNSKYMGGPDIPVIYGRNSTALRYINISHVYTRIHFGNSFFYHHPGTTMPVISARKPFQTQIPYNRRGYVDK